MTPFEITYIAQERCRELRGEIREPSMKFFEPRLRISLARFLHNLGNKLESKPQAIGRMTTNLKKG